MATQPGGKRHTSLRVWIRPFRRLWHPLKWFWGAVILAFFVNDGATLLITKSIDVSGTPLGWLLGHLGITLPLVGVLILLTYLAGLAHRQAETPTVQAVSLPVPSRLFQARDLTKGYIAHVMRNE